MSRTATTTGEQLTDALRALGVNFIMGGKSEDESLHRHPARLIAALAESNEARLRLSLIPLFLEHPEFAVYVRDVTNSLSSPARLTLQCYYSAAVWLAEKYSLRESPLPDHFSQHLGLQVTSDPGMNLSMLARRHGELSGSQVNWLGTYYHAAQVWLKGLELKRG